VERDAFVSAPSVAMNDLPKIDQNQLGESIGGLLQK